MRSLPALAAVLLCLAATAWGQDGEAPEMPWRLVWQDEFDGPAGRPPSPERWVCDLGTDWGNKQLEYDTDHPANAGLDGRGHLAITARAEEYQGQPYTSARLKTQGLFERRYGRFEARLKLPAGQGLWPAFWLLGADIDQVGWPRCGEIDIMEYRGHQPRVLVGSIHGPGHWGDDCVTATHELASGGFDDDFHVFALEWSPDAITWLLDGVAWQRVTPDDLPAGAEWVYDHPFFIILNVAVGGRWAGAPDASTTFPQTMLVDYVRVHAPGP